MDTTVFLMWLFVIVCVIYWLPEIKYAYYYYKPEIEDFVKYLRFKLKIKKNE